MDCPPAHLHRFREFMAPGYWRGTALALLVFISAEHGLAAKEDRTFEVAMAADVRGKFVEGACWPFAQELYNRLTRARIETHLVVYRWSDDWGRSGAHAVIFYRDAERRLWAIDNLRRQPLWVKGQSAQEWCSFFAPGQTVKVTLHRTGEEKRSKPKKGFMRTVQVAVKPVTHSAEALPESLVPAADRLALLCATQTITQEPHADRREGVLY